MTHKVCFFYILHQFHSRKLVEFMHHFFLGDEMCCLVDKVHKCSDIMWPVIENVIGVLGLLEVYNAGQSIDLGLYCLVDNKVRQEFLSFLQHHTGKELRLQHDPICHDSRNIAKARTVCQDTSAKLSTHSLCQIKQCRHPLHVYPGVELRHHSNILWKVKQQMSPSILVHKWWFTKLYVSKASGTYECNQNTNRSDNVRVLPPWSSSPSSACFPLLSWGWRPGCLAQCCAIPAHRSDRDLSSAWSPWWWTISETLCRGDKEDNYSSLFYANCVLLFMTVPKPLGHTAWVSVVTLTGTCSYSLVCAHTHWYVGSSSKTLSSLTLCIKSDCSLSNGERIRYKTTHFSVCKSHTQHTRIQSSHSCHNYFQQCIIEINMYHSFNPLKIQQRTKKPYLCHFDYSDIKRHTSFLFSVSSVMTGVS